MSLERQDLETHGSCMSECSGTSEFEDATHVVTGKRETTRFGEKTQEGHRAQVSIDMCHTCFSFNFLN